MIFWRSWLGAEKKAFAGAWCGAASLTQLPPDNYNRTVCRGLNCAGGINFVRSLYRVYPTLRIQSKPIRTVLRWQMIAAVALAMLGGLVAGMHGATSAALGGLVAVIAGLAFTVVIQISKAQSAGGTLATALRAESIKIGLSVFLLWLVLTSYTEVVALAFIGSFLVSILIFSMAFFVREV